MTTNLTHRDTAAGHLERAEEIIDELAGGGDLAGDIALAQTHALIAIGHALVDLAKDGLTTYNQ
jgi:hypothetical protein